MTVASGGLFLGRRRRRRFGSRLLGMGSQPRPQVEGQLVGIELFRAASENPAPQRLQLRGQLTDPTIFLLKSQQKLYDQLSQSLKIGRKLGLVFHLGARV